VCRFALVREEEMGRRWERINGYSGIVDEEM